MHIALSNSTICHSHHAIITYGCSCKKALEQQHRHLSRHAPCVAQGRTALDLLSEERKVFIEQQQAGLVYSWGNGANYQLGTGATGLQAGPVRLDALRKQLVVHIAAAKFHSAAVTQDGQLFTWGFGRGGRLGGLVVSDTDMLVLKAYCCMMQSAV